MFLWKKSKPSNQRTTMVQKHCEFCGMVVSQPWYSAILSIQFYIPPFSALVRQIDQQQWAVQLSNGATYEYIPMSQNILAVPTRGNEHLMCSEACEDAYANKYLKRITPQLHAMEGGGIAIVDVQHSGAFSPMVMADKSVVQGERKKCIHCQCEYPSYGRVWNRMEIESVQKVAGKYEAPPKITQTGVKVALSGLTHEKPIGDWYVYEFKMIPPKPVSICCYDCAFAYSKKESCAIMAESVLEEDKMGFIVPETEVMNRTLGAKIPHRPQFVQKMRKEPSPLDGISSASILDVSDMI